MAEHPVRVSRPPAPVLVRTAATSNLRSAIASLFLLLVVLLAGRLAFAAAGHAGVRALVVDPATPDTLYAALDVFGVFKTTDRGAHWIPMNGGLPGIEGPPDSRLPPDEPLRVTTLAIDRRRSRRVYAGTSCGIYKSMDGGRHWRSANGRLGPGCLYVTALVSDPKVPSTLYAGIDTDPEGIHKTRNRGRRWRLLDGGVVSAIAIDSARHLTVYQGKRDFLMERSADGGRHWAPTGYLPVYGSVTSLLVAPDHDVYLALAVYPSPHVESGAGVFRSRDEGATWNDASAGLQRNSVLALAIDPSTPATLYARTDGGGVFRSDDAGAAWVPASNGLTGSYGDGTICDGSPNCVVVDTIVHDPTRSGRLYVGTEFGLDYAIPGRVFASDDGGRSWTERSAGLPE
jgi:photosystem II stability/assembly factor-like uncharacterized protein